MLPVLQFAMDNLCTMDNEWTLYQLQNALLLLFAIWKAKMLHCVLDKNIRSFDCPILIHHLVQNDLLKEFDDVVCGFSDSLSLYKQLLPDRKPSKREDLVSGVIGQAYDAHNAMADVAALRRLVESTPVPHEVLE